MRNTMFGVAFMVLVNVVNAQDQESREKSTGPTTAFASAQAIPENAAIRFDGFVQLAQELQVVRKARRVPIETFVKMSQDPQTIVLDTRSKRAFDVVHKAGAIHLNFSDFADEKLRKLIPSKDTRILIYCNNNFKKPTRTNVPGADGKRTGTNKDNEEIVEGTTNKAPRLALNIPTFINLHGYGYKNVYELADQLELDDPRLKLEGQAVNID